MLQDLSPPPWEVDALPNLQELAQEPQEAPADDLSEITLTAGQEAALQAFTLFLMSPTERVFVIEGYSGTGKTTLVRTLLQRLPGIRQAAKMLNPKLEGLAVELTATTNKAAEAFHHLAKQPVGTIHSFLNLRVETDYKNMETRLTIGPRATVKEQYLLFIDEASFIDRQLLRFIFQLTKNCKIVFIGDPAQITPVNSSETPVFNSGFPTARLTQVVRQAEGNPIIEVATKFRNWVNNGEDFAFAPDGHTIQRLPRHLFDQAIVDEFSRPDWTYHDSKVLAYTNKRVIAYNHAIRDLVKGSPNFQVGDYAVCNAYVKGRGRNGGLRTDEMVHITAIDDPTVEKGVTGRWYTLGQNRFFGPSDLQEWKAAINRLHAAQDFMGLAEMDECWVDLRAAFACTLNKSQGSTFNKVFIDLDDVKVCTNGNTMARLLYVGISRARTQVFLTGDIC